MADRCPATYTFHGMQTVFECQNRPDVPAEPYRGRPAWKHLHGPWHYFEDEDGDGARFRVMWTDGNGSPEAGR